MDCVNHPMPVQHKNPIHSLGWRTYKNELNLTAALNMLRMSEDNMRGGGCHMYWMAMKGSESTTEQNDVEVMHQTCTQEVLNFNLDQETGHPD
jgi:hypothetical protein